MGPVPLASVPPQRDQSMLPSRLEKLGAFARLYIPFN